MFRRKGQDPFIDWNRTYTAGQLVWIDDGGSWCVVAVKEADEMVWLIAFAPLYLAVGFCIHGLAFESGDTTLARPVSVLFWPVLVCLAIGIAMKGVR